MASPIAAVIALGLGFTLGIAGFINADGKDQTVKLTAKPEAVDRFVLRTAAQRAYDATFERYKAGSLDDLEPLYQWSIRLRDADLSPRTGVEPRT